MIKPVHAIAQRSLALFFTLTICAELTQGAVLLNTGFEGSTNLPSGWTQSQISGDATWKIQTGAGGGNPSSALGGVNNATLYSGSDSTNRLISPIFLTAGYTNISLRFWHAQAFWNPDQDELKVLYSVNGGTNWTQLAYYANDVAAWTQRTLTLPTNSASGRIAFEGYTTYGYGVCLDDIQVTGYTDQVYDLNILVIGSTHSFSEGGESGVVHEKPFDPTTIAFHLRQIIDQDPAISESVNVEFEDIFKTKLNTVRTSLTGIDDITAHCYSLAQHFMWPEGKTNRLANLRGQAGTQWDHIILCQDPYMMANFPGMVAEGVKLIKQEVAKSATPAQVMLLAQWPESSSTFTPTQFNEIAYRVGNSASLTVVPAGKAWDSYSSKDTSSIHPTPHGEYLAAASIYSKLFNRSAKTSAYDYPSEGDAIADHALSVVQANAGVSQYSGAYTNINPFQMKYLTKRVVNYRQTGTSTEQRMYWALERLDDVQRITFGTAGYAGVPGTRWDFNYGRGNDTWEDDKDYEVDTNKYDWVYGFPMHHYFINEAFLTMPYGIDKYYFGGSYNDGTDLGIPYNMIRPNTREPDWPEAVRAIPIRLMWLKMCEVSPGYNPLEDNSHMGPYLNDAIAAFMYTLMSGRCPIVNEPTPQGSSNLAWMQWLGHKTGYETAWQMSHLTTRAPGFQVMPRLATATTVTTGTVETITVQFTLPPRSNVTVQVTTDNPKAVIFNSQTLLFTTNNYFTPQTVTFAGIPGATNSDAFNMRFNTTSDDEVCNALSDAWAYTTTRTVTQATLISENGTNVVIGSENIPVAIYPNITGMASGNTVFAGPGNGSVVVSSTNLVYTPNLGYVGPDSFAYAVNFGGTVTRGYVTITINPSSMKSVNVISAQGGVNPGSVITNSGVALSFAITNSPYISGGTIKYVANGGTVTGNSYTLVNSTNITLTLTNSCTLTWAWKTNYWLALSTAGEGSVNATNSWHASGTSVVVTATASNLWVFTGWSGATNGCTIAGNIITATMTNARSITATFVQPFPIVDNSAGAISLTTTSATLQAVLTDGISATGYFCWGSQDAGTASTGDWQNVVSIGSVTEDVVFTRTLTSLSSNVTYWYRCFTTNANGAAWTPAAKPFSGSPSGVSWSPTDVSKVSLWLDADDASKVVLNGGTVSNWLDKSGYNRHASQTTAGSQPADTAAGLNGKHVLRFDGTSDYLNVDLDFLAGVSHSAFIVTKVTTYNNLYGAATANSTSNSLHVGFISSSAYRMNYWGHDWITCAISSNFKAGQGNLLNYAWRVGTSKEIFANGSSEGSNVAANAIGPMAGGGRIAYVTGNYFAGDIGEIIMCTGTVSVAERQLFEGYLANKWGLSANLPTNHPYKAQAPGLSDDAINNKAPTSITTTGAVFNASLVATGTSYTVTAYWGTSNGGTNSGSWTSSALVGSWTNTVTDVSTSVNSLAQGQTYYYTFCASNAFGRAWATPSWTFTTAGVSGAMPSYTLTATSGSNGSISPIGTVTIGHGSNQTFTVTADTNYHIDDVLVDSASVGAVASYTFSTVTANHTISASFAINQYTVQFVVGANGTRTGGGTLTQTVNHGIAATAPTITANIGYTFVGWDASFDNVTSHLTINAVYTQLPTYITTATSGPGGSISPSGAVTVAQGSSQTFTVTATTGYHITDVLADSASVGAISSYTFTNVVAAHTISASFAINQYTVLFVEGTHGTRTSGGALSQTVNHGAAATAPVITPDAGYIFTSWGASFSSITSNLTVNALYEPLPTHTITATSGIGGSLAPSGTVTVMQGSNQTFTVTANTDYQITNVLVDSTSVGAVASYTFTNVTAPHTISASFTLVIPYTVPFFEPFEARDLGGLNGQYGWVADGTVVQTNTTFNTSTNAAQILGEGGYLKRAFSDNRTKVWTDMRLQVIQSSEKPTPETDATVAVYVSTNTMVMAFDGTNVVSTKLTAQQGDWLRLTMFSDYAAKTYILYVNDQRAGKYGFYNAGVTNFTEFKVSGEATFVDNVGVTLNQPGMKGMPSLILLQ